MRRKKKTSKELDELRKEHRRMCRIRHVAIILAYAIDLAVKAYLIFMVGGEILAFCGAAIDFIAKWYMLTTMKMRKNGIYNRS